MSENKTYDKECQACVAALWDILQAERGSRAFEAALKRGRQIYDKYREGPILDHGAYQVEMPKEVSSARGDIERDAARYRWLSQQACHDSEEDLQREGIQFWRLPELARTWFKADVVYSTLDAAIDASMSAAQTSYVGEKK